MPAAEQSVRKPALSWLPVLWFGVCLAAIYFPVLRALVRQWSADEDMSHGFFVPLIAGYIVWAKRKELVSIAIETNWWGLALVAWGAAQLLVGALAVELFLMRTSLVITLFGLVWTLGGTRMLRALLFPLSLLFLMVPIPTVVYNSITFPLQLVASSFAENALSLCGVPVIREGNVLSLPNQQLSVVEACSGIRSLLSLTFLSLVYGYFFEGRRWLRVVLFLSTIPIAIVANGLRVTMTGLLGQVKPELAEGAFHEASGWVIFMIALAILIFWHQGLVWAARRAGKGAHHEVAA